MYLQGLTKGTAALENIGNTCFLGAALQCLRCTPGLLEAMAPELLADPSAIPPDPPGLLAPARRPAPADGAQDALPVRPRSAMAGSAARSVGSAYANLPKPSSADSTLQRISSAHTAEAGDRFGVDAAAHAAAANAALAEAAALRSAAQDSGGDSPHHASARLRRSGSGASEAASLAADTEATGAAFPRRRSLEVAGLLSERSRSIERAERELAVALEHFDLPAPSHKLPFATAVVGGVALTTPPIAEHPGSACASADRVAPMLVRPECAELRAELDGVLPRSRRFDPAVDPFERLPSGFDLAAAAPSGAPSEADAAGDAQSGDEARRGDVVPALGKRVASDAEVATSFLHVMVKLAALHQPTVIAPRALMCNIRDNPSVRLPPPRCCVHECRLKTAHHKARLVRSGGAVEAAGEQGRRRAHAWCTVQGAEYANGGHHDSQELLNWCLQKLSEANNRVAATAASPAAATPRVADAAPQAQSAAPAASIAGDASPEHPASEHMSPRQQAEAEWRGALARESSAIVDWFQGQLQSCVVCSRCDKPSYTYEAFTSLAVAPHKDSASPRAASGFRAGGLGARSMWCCQQHHIRDPSLVCRELHTTLKS